MAEVTKVTRAGKKPKQRKSGDLETHGNQWTNSERQNRWLKYYLDPGEKETYGNAYSSAIKAGYSHGQAKNIINKGYQWVQNAENVTRLNPEHIKAKLIDIIKDDSVKTGDQLTALKMLGTDMGMFVEKKVIATVPLEQALNDLE